MDQVQRLLLTGQINTHRKGYQKKKEEQEKVTL